MKLRWTQALRKIVPKAWRRWLGRRLYGVVYTGDFHSWGEARAASEGYDAGVILDRTVVAARAVRAGQGQWERDTVVFHAPAVHAPLLAALRRAAAMNDGRLVVMDFGGSLGSTWWQHRRWLEDLKEVRWSVVEQPGMVAAGQREFSAGPLRFYETIAGCVAAERPDVALLSSVLPYLESPHRVLREIAGGGFRHLIIDRTGFVPVGRDRLTVQRVPAEIYPASYPCWFFDRTALLKPFERDWRVVAEWPGFDRADIDATFSGLALERIAP